MLLTTVGPRLEKDDLVRNITSLVPSGEMRSPASRTGQPIFVAAKSSTEKLLEASHTRPAAKTTLCFGVSEGGAGTMPFGTAGGGRPSP